MQDDALVVSELTDLRGVEPLDREPGGALEELDPTARALHRRRETLARWRAHEHAAAAKLCKLVDRALAHEPASVDHDDVVDGLRRLGQDVAREQDGPAA